MAEEERITCNCVQCGKTFPLKYDDYGDPTPQTIAIDSCLSGGIYGIEVKCPHCGHEHTVL